MNADNFADYVEHPSHLYQITWQELNGLVQQYPYCQNLRYLLARKSKLDGRKDQKQNLLTAAVYSIDRSFLYQQFTNPKGAVEQSENVKISDDFLQVGELGESTAKQTPSPSPDQLEAHIHFVEPEIEEEPLILDLGTKEPITPQSASDNYVPLNELAEMDEKKLNEFLAGKTGEPGAKKNVIFIEDLMAPSTQEEENDTTKKGAEVKEDIEAGLGDKAVTQETEENTELKTTVEGNIEELEEQVELAATVEGNSEEFKEKIELTAAAEENIEEIEEKIELAAAVEEKVEEIEEVDDIILEEEEEELIRDEEDIPLEITEDSRPVAPVPKASFGSWLQQFQSPSLSIRYKNQEVIKIKKTVEEPPAAKIVEKKPKTPEQKAKSSKEKKLPKRPSTKAFAAKSLNVHDDLASETLAKLHERQGNYDQAIAMYEKLSLIFPEKSPLFAVKIKKLKNL